MTCEIDQCTRCGYCDLKLDTDTYRAEEREIAEVEKKMAEESVGTETINEQSEHV